MAAIQSLPTSVMAQEINRVWTTSDAINGPFQSESAVKAAIVKGVVDHVPDGPMLKFQSGPSLILKDKVISSIDVTPLPPKTGPWTWLFRADNAVSLDDAVAKAKAWYDNESTVTGCAPNTTVTVDANSQKTYWTDGTTLRAETYPFSVTYQSGASGTCKPVTYTDQKISGSRDVGCPSFLTWDPQKQACAGGGFFASGDRAYYSTQVLAPGQCPIGNPCDPTTGDKMQPEEDFDLGWVSFTRYFHSMTSTPTGGLGDNWTHSHNLRLTAGPNPTSWDDTVYVGLIEADGSQISFTQVGDAYESDDGKGDHVVKEGEQWKLYRSDRVMRFGADGRLLEQQFDGGTSLTYGYDAKQRLATITHSSGRSLVFAYVGDGANDPIASISSAGQAVVTYGYTAGGQVETATYANSLGRLYHYEDTRFPRYLTGVTTELGQRFSTFAYDDKGRVISSQHAGGADGVTLSYPVEGGTKFTNPLGQETELQLANAPWSGAPQKISGLKDTRGTIATTYNDEDSDFRRRVASTTDRKGIQTLHSYAEAIDTVTGALARTETITEANGKPEQRVRTITTDVATGRLIRSTIGNQETRIARNVRLQPVTVTVRDTVTNELRTTTFAYCEAADVLAVNTACPTLGLLKFIDGPRTDVNDITRFEYYSSDDSTCATSPALCTYRKGDLRKTIDALGRATEVFGYDPQGRPLSVLDPNGVVTDYEYTPRGWLTATKVRGADNGVETDDRVTVIEHDPDGLVKKVTLPGGVYTRYTYNLARQLTDVIDNAGNTVHYTLDLAGSIKQQDIKTAGGTLKQTLSRVFNTLGQLVALKDASQNATVFTYDNNGNPKDTTDALSRKSTATYDPLNRLSRTLEKVTLVAGNPSEDVTTILKYNALDQVTQVTDPKNLNTIYAYNGFGDRTKLTSPDTGVTTYTYNEVGLLATKKDANDAAANRYTYDALGRPKAIFYTASGPADVEYDYDTVNAECTTGQTFALGRLTASRTEGNELKYCYDRFGQVVRKVQIVAGKSFTLKYAYTIGGHLYTVTYPDGTTVDYARDAQARIKEIGARPYGGTRTVLLNNAAYEPFGPVSGWTYGNGRTLSRTYDQDYRPKTILDTASGGLSLGYGYNAVGDLTELKDGLLSANQAQYDYDELGRLRTTRDASANPVEAYIYDKTGNRLGLTHGGITDAYVYPTATNHRLGSVAGVARTYNTVGNTTSINGTAKQYVYNANDRLSQFKQGGVIKASYRYNAIGERIATTGATTSAIDTYTIYDEAGNWIGDYDSTGAAKQQAVWFGSAPVGLVVGSGGTQTLLYVQPDHLGTPRAAIDPARNVAVWTWDAKSEAFGNSPPNQDPDLDGTAFVFNMRFPGQRYDAATGLNYNINRDYEPGVGRYVQSDPIGLRGGLALYSYAGASPVMTVDPLGLKPRIYVNGNNITIIEPVNFGIDPGVTPEAARRAFEEAEKVWTKKIGKCNVRMRIIDGRNDPSAVKVQLRRLDLYETNNMNNWYIPNPSDGHYWNTFDWSTFGHEVGHDLLNYPDNLAPRKERPTVMGTDYTTVPAFSVSAWDIARLLERWTDKECECN